MTLPIQNIAPPVDIRGVPLTEARQTTRTAKIQSASHAITNQFSSMVEGKEAIVGSQSSSKSREALGTSNQQSRRIDAAVQGLDAALIRNMIENMQSSQTSSLFGKGTAGSVWKSMFTDVMAEQLSRTEFTGLREAIRSSIPGLSPGSAGPAAKVNPGNAAVPPAEQPSAPDTLQDVFANLWQNMISAFDLAEQGKVIHAPGKEER